MHPQLWIHKGTGTPLTSGCPGSSRLFAEFFNSDVGHTDKAGLPGGLHMESEVISARFAGSVEKVISCLRYTGA